MPVNNYKKFKVDEDYKDIYDAELNDSVAVTGGWYESFKDITILKDISTVHDMCHDI